jgi:hypothetical protein
MFYLFWSGPDGLVPGSDVVIMLCNVSFISILYGFVPLETGIARDSCFLGLSRRCRESGFHSRKFGSFQPALGRRDAGRAGGRAGGGDAARAAGVGLLAGRGVGGWRLFLWLWLLVSLDYCVVVRILWDVWDYCNMWCDAYRLWFGNLLWILWLNLDSRLVKFVILNLGEMRWEMKIKRMGNRAHGEKRHLYRFVTPPGTNLRHLYRASRPVQMLHLICTRWFVPVGYPVKIRVTKQYKWVFFK